MNEIVLSQLSIGYNRKVVAHDLTATFSASTLSCLLGRNGVGKSTLLRTISGYLKPAKNSVFIGKTDVSTASRQEMAHLVSIVQTQRPDVHGITVEEMVAMGRIPHTNLFGTLTENDRVIVRNSLRKINISKLSNRQVNTLSDGEMQKTMLAKALAQQTPVILLDEPTAFLDYPSKVEVLTLLRSLAHDEGKTIVLSTHEVELAARLADTLLYMTPTCLKEISELTEIPEFSDSFNEFDFLRNPENPENPKKAK